jgi:hypothetical protein
MIKNMGLADRTIRVVAAIIIAILYVTGRITGTLAVILGLVAVVFLVTSAMAFCPAYLPFKIDTARKK